MVLDANTYLSSLGIDVTDAAQPAIGRLALAGEFVLGGERGVLLRPKRGDVSDRYLELLAGEGYAFVIVDEPASSIEVRHLDEDATPDLVLADPPRVVVRLASP